MKKSLLMISLLAFQHLAAASCIIQGNSVTWTMSIHNSTPDALDIFCVNSPSSLHTTVPSSIHSDATVTAVWAADQGTTAGGQGVVSSSCTITDKNEKSIVLTLNFRDCNDVDPVPEPVYDKPLGSYVCLPNEHSISGTMVYNTYYYDIVDIYPTFTLAWNNIITNLAKGQTMANKLAANLLKAIQYDKSTAAYNANSKSITITLSKPNPNPYEGSTNCSATQAQL